MRRLAVLLALVALTYIAVGAPGAVQAQPGGELPVGWVGSVSVVEGDSRGAWRDAVLTVTLSGPAAAAVSVDYATVGGTAAPGDDYQPTTGTLTIAAGSGSAVFAVPVKGDQTSEATETVTVELSNPVGVALARTQATISIRDLAGAPDGLSMTDVGVVEPDDTAAVKVVASVALPATPPAPVTVAYTTAPGTAVAPRDFLARTGTVTIVPPARAARIQLWVRGDVEIEGDETFTIDISSTDAPVADPTGTITIHDSVVTERVSISSTGEQANSASYNPAISADGQEVAFWSYASNLAPGDTNNTGDIFVRDRASGTTSRVSVNSDGQQADRDASTPDVSGDGRYVVWASAATNLKTGVISAKTQIWLHDRTTGQTSRISEQPDGTRGYGDSYSPTISADGRYIVYATNAANLADGDTNTSRDCVIHDRTTATTQVVSRTSDGSQFAAPCLAPQVSANGRFVAFGVNVTPQEPGVFLRDLVAGTTTLISLDNNGQPADPTPVPRRFTLDDTGRYVAFYCSGLACGGSEGMYLRDQVAGTLTRPPVGADDITPDGRWLAGAGGLLDLTTGRRFRIDVTPAGTTSAQGSSAASLTPDSKTVGYQSADATLVAGDTNGFDDIFLAELG